MIRQQNKDRGHNEDQIKVPSKNSPRTQHASEQELGARMNSSLENAGSAHAPRPRVTVVPRMPSAKEGGGRKSLGGGRGVTTNEGISLFVSLEEMADT